MDFASREISDRFGRESSPEAHAVFPDHLTRLTLVAMLMMHIGRMGMRVHESCMLMLMHVAFAGRIL